MDFFNLLTSSLWSVLMIAVFFGGSIFVHELGHFLTARRHGFKIERFSIGFGPAIFKWVGKDGVEYRLSWFPLGGYVALPQLGDMRAIEGGETPAEKLPTPRYGAKMEVLVAGAVCNVIFALALACILWGVGVPTMSSLNTTKIGVVEATVKRADGVLVPSPAVEAGLRPGDIIRAIDGKTVDNWSGLVQTLASGAGRAGDGRPEAVLTIERGGVSSPVVIYPVLAGEEGFRTIGISTADDMGIDQVVPDSAAAAAGFKEGDVILSLDGAPMLSREGLTAALQVAAGRTVTVAVQRAGARVDLPVAARLEKNPDGSPAYRIGVRYRNELIYIHPNPLKQLADNATMTWRVLSGLVNPNSDLGPSKLSGPVGIARGFHQTAQIDIRLVLWFTILVNVNLAMFNLLPLPVLDGGHMLFATIGKLRGRPLPPSFIVNVQTVFVALLFTMVLYVSFFDVRRIARDVQAESAPAQKVENVQKRPAPVPSVSPAPAEAAPAAN
jgi:regulator of sigma E protease